jgi:hypothetical protein
LIIVPCQVPVPIVPTLVNEEAVTPDPRVLFERTSAPLTLYVLLLATSTFSEDVQADVELTQLRVLSVAPLSVIPPPSAVVLVGVATSARTTFLSSTTRFVVLIFVVVPLIVKSPETVKFPPIVALDVTASPVPETFVAEIVSATPRVLESKVAPVTPRVLESVVAPVTPRVLESVAAPNIPTPPLASMRRRSIPADPNEFVRNDKLQFPEIELPRIETDVLLVVESSHEMALLACPPASWNPSPPPSTDSFLIGLAVPIPTLPVRVVTPVTAKLPPTLTFFSIPIPPSTTRDPVSLSVD